MRGRGERDRERGEKREVRVRNERA